MTGRCGRFMWTCDAICRSILSGPARLPPDGPLSWAGSRVLLLEAYYICGKPGAENAKTPRSCGFRLDMERCSW